MHEKNLMGISGDNGKKCIIAQSKEPQWVGMAKFDGIEVHYDGMFIGKCFIKTLLMNLIRYCHWNAFT